MLNTIQLMKLKNLEFTRFFRSFIDFLNDDLSFTSSIDKELSPLISKLDKIDVILRYNRKSEYTDELKKADRLRKNAIIGIRKYAEANTYHYNNDIKIAAKHILDILDKFGSSITLIDKFSRTSSINNVITVIKKDNENINALATLQLNDWINKLDETNQTFTSILRKSVKKKSEKSTDKIKDLRQQASNDYYELRDYINACYKLNTETFSPVVARLNQLIKEYNTLVNRRKGRSKRKRPSAKENTQQ